MTSKSWTRYVIVSAGVLALFAALPGIGADNTASVVPPSQSRANYELAAKWTSQKIGKLVFDLAVTPHWLESGERFWYAFESTKGRKFWLVDPVHKTKTYVFDPVKMAAALTSATGLPYDSQHLPITVIRFVRNDGAIQFEVNVPRDAVIPGEKKTGTMDAVQQTEAGQQNDELEYPQQQQGRGGSLYGAAPTRSQKQLTFDYELSSGKLELLSEHPQRKPAWSSVSPDGKTVVFARNHNLYTMDADNFAKARKNANISWSRDSRRFAVVRRDQRKIPKLWVINALANPRPTLETYPYAMPGEANAPQSQLEVFEVASRQKVLIKADAFKDQTIQVQVERPTPRAREHDRTEPVWANSGSDKLYFTRLSRDMKRLDLCVVDVASGQIKPLIQERMNVYLEDKPPRIINNGSELIWWSERDGWGHYYLYGADGTLKNQIEKGEYVAEDISYVDEKARVLYMTASGHEDGEDPYFMHFYRVNLDGSGSRLLDPGDASHTAAMSDSGRYFVDTFSRVNTAPESVLADGAGATVMPLEKLDMAPLLAAGYHYPEPFKVKADDGITDLYGVMYKPFDFDPSKKYPVIEYVYPGPQTESVTKTFTPKGNTQQILMANMGFIMIEIGNRGGNPHRSKWYHTFGYGNLRDYGLADKKAAIEQLAREYSFIDIDRMGIWGHSGGGFMTAAALLIYPDFFKVGWSESGNHENNILEDYFAKYYWGSDGSLNVGTE